MKKIISLLLVLMLVVSCAAVAFAADTIQTTNETGEGSITIQGASTENVYTIYKMLELSLNETNGAYTYTVSTLWADFFKEGEPAREYIDINNAGAASWIGVESATRKEAFAKLAMQYVNSKNSDSDATNNIYPVRSSKVEGQFVFTGSDGKFSNLPLGYYLVDSTMGALCGLTTTNKHGSIQAKNAAPILYKHVKEEDTNQYINVSTADIGEVVEYRITIEVHAGAQNYVIHDIMEEGLTYVGNLRMEHMIPGSASHEVPATKYTVNQNTADGCDVEIVFSQEFCDELKTNHSVVVYYDAVLNEKAEIHSNTPITVPEGTTVGNGSNENTAWLSFGDAAEKHETVKQTVSTSTFFVDIIKTDAADKPLEGAEFTIYNAETGGAVVTVVAGADEHHYVRNAAAGAANVSIKVGAGGVRVSGLDKGTYYLEETAAPEGYNALTARQRFVISTGNLEATNTNGVYTTGSGVQVINSTGTRLPETGGLGTLLFTILGGSTALGTGVVLVTKKRMSKIEDED